MTLGPNTLEQSTAERPTRDPRPVRPLRVVIVDEELPYPPNSGKRLRTFHLVMRLGRRHRITLLTPRNADPVEFRDAAAFFGDQGIETVGVDRPAPPRTAVAAGPGLYVRLAANLLSPRPYQVDAHNGPALRRAVGAYAAAHQVDLWQGEWTPFAETLRTLTGARTLVMAHNVESLIWERYHQTETNPLKRWYVKEQWRKFEHFERRAFAEATRTVLVSDEDAALARSRFGARRVSVVENGVDTTAFRPLGGPRDPRRILFLGSLDWRPNLDAVRLLLDQIFPAVLAEEPSALLMIVGRNPPAWVVDRANALERVELVANPPDVRPYLAQSGLMAVPLRIGGGSRLKILEALASGLPVVSTRVGAEGLRLEPDRDLVVVERPEEMARALVGCIQAPHRALERAERGRRVVLDRYDWDGQAEKLEQAWLQCLED